MYRTATCGVICFPRLFVIVSILFFSCCVNKERVINNALHYESFEEEFIPKGDVIKIETLSGNTIFMDEDSTYFLGDVVFSKEQVEKLMEVHSKSTLINGFLKYWTSYDIPYYIQTGFPTSAETAIINGIQLLATALPAINFHRVYSTPSEGLVFVPSPNSNSSPVGKSSSGVNYINISINTTTAGIATHEVMHSLGFFHEQSRTDRDSYVIIYWNNIESGKEHNFYTFAYEGYDGRNWSYYDYNSIMHYGSWAFPSTPGLYTMLTIGGAYIYSQRSYLSYSDLAGLNLIYGPTPHIVNTMFYNYDDRINSGIEEYKYHNVIHFQNENDSNYRLDYDRMVWVRHTVNSLSYGSTEYQQTQTDQCIFVQGGESEYTLPDSRFYQESDMGNVVVHYSDYYTILK